MWKFKRQVRFRRYFVILFFVALSYYLFLHFKSYTTFSDISLKPVVDEFGLIYEQQPNWFIYAAIGVITFLTIFGLPSMVTFILAYLYLNDFQYKYYISFSIVLFAQVAASYFTIFVSRLLSLRRDVIKTEFEKVLDSPIIENHYAFWTRLYFFLPLRTIDSHTPRVAHPKTPIRKIMLYGLPAIILRLLLPTLWFKIFIDCFATIPLNKGVEYTKLAIVSFLLSGLFYINKSKKYCVYPHDLKIFFNYFAEKK